MSRIHIPIPWKHTARKKSLAQAMVEFGLVLPILLLVMYGLIETGRLVFMYASVVSSSRQAVRYGSVTGENGSGTEFYNDCDGIRNAAKRLGFLQHFDDSDILISYDTGPGTAPLSTSCPLGSAGHPTNGDRITVDVSTSYSPIVPLVPFRPFVIRSAGTRTLLVGVSVAVDVPGVVLTPGGSGNMSLFKDSVPPYFDDVGQVIQYTYTLTNLGGFDISGINMTDDKVAAVFCGAATDPLPAGDATQCTGSYVTTQADVDFGFITNIATASGTSDGKPLVSQASLTINFIPHPELSLAKEGLAPEVVRAGNLATYTFTLTNTGNVPLNSPYTISDNKIGSDWSCAAAVSPLAVDASTTCTGTYVLKTQDLQNEQVTNTATATANHGTFTVTSNVASSTVVLPELLLTLTASPTSVSSLGQTITYTYTVKNRTNKSMSFINISASRGPTGFQCAASLASQAQATCTRTYSTYTQTDMNNGSFANTAEASGWASTPLRFVRSNNPVATVTVLQTIQLALTKTADRTQATNVGDVITYGYSFTNTGNVTLTGPYAIIDDKVPTVDCSAATAAGPLAPAAARSCANATYTVTQADVDVYGSVVNKAKATAKFGTNTITSPEVSKVVTTYTGARLGLIKTANPAYFSAGGQTLTYTFTLLNRGGRVLSSPYTVTDPLIPAVNCTGAAPTIPVGGSTACTGSYLVTTANSNAGFVTNLATATAKDGAVTISSAPATLTVNKFVCLPATIKHTDPTPIPSGASVQWTIVNNSGAALSITSISIGWSANPPALNLVKLAGVTIMSTPTSSSGGYIVPGQPWPLPMGNTILQLDFSAVASNIRVVVTATGPNNCNALIDSNLTYPS